MRAGVAGQAWLLVRSLFKGVGNKIRTPFRGEGRGQSSGQRAEGGRGRTEEEERERARIRPKFEFSFARLLDRRRRQQLISDLVLRGHLLRPAVPHFEINRRVAAAAAAELIASWRN